MDINIVAPGHANFSDVEEYYTSALTTKYDAFEFIKAIEVRIRKENQEYNVKLIASLEKSPKVMAEDNERNENMAFKNALKKMDSIIRRYKSKHFHGI